ncbi:hypothetical protein [Microbacterium amylolyticum]|uniref:PASTA domain-containing protein n=1 Tax=Microbacterium amylolyticum TaxID=936337 RepID=A0ABS4ZFU1_9MICO|nr:hypothetical protein [Microbacterium amylolyticum]MBP2435903.1 hypothetical protein [Microbacterium amylolyticum]
MSEKKPFWKKPIAWGIATAVVLAGIISAGVASENDGSESSVAADSTIEVPVVAGLPGDEARDLLRDAGFSVSGDGGDETPVAYANWDATGTTPAGTAEEGSAVTLHLVRADERLAAEKEAQEAEREKEREERDAQPVDGTIAQSLCEQTADREFPYGVKLHWIMDKLADEQTDDGWYLKVGATVTNEFGAEQSGVNVECHVGGTVGNPVMESFLAY